MLKNSHICRRIGVFVFYDANGMVDDYVEMLLGSMKEVLQKLIVIVNGCIQDKDCCKLKKYSQQIFVRENFGYDAGAYKDAFTKYLVDEDWEQWDELILFNDTFYGPFYPWNEALERMEKDEIDFWGLSRFPSGGKFPTGKEICEHIQGYFLACKKNMFISKEWLKFWDDLEYPRTYQEAIENFEIYFSQYFLEKGYKNKALTDDERVVILQGENPTMWKFDELIRNIRFPIIKRRVFCLIHLDLVRRTADYIENNTNYDISLISSHLGRLCKETEFCPIAPFDSVQLELFYNRHERIYIYGHGIYGKGIAAYFEFKGWKYEGFIVTENRECIRDFVYCNMDFTAGDGIVLALGELALSEVYPEVRKKLKKEHLYCLSYDDTQKRVG